MYSAPAQQPVPTPERDKDKAEERRGEGVHSCRIHFFSNCWHARCTRRDSRSNFLEGDDEESNGVDYAAMTESDEKKRYHA